MNENSPHDSTAHARDPLPDGGSSASAVPAPSAGEPVRMDQPTIISSSPPLGAADLAETASDVSQSLLGERLEHFELQELVGGGGMGVVFRALDTRLNRDVAVKILARHHQNDEETVRRFRNEAQSAARLEHENIARVYHVGEDRGLAFIVFEFIDGANLRDLVARSGPLPLEEALGYTLQVAQALAHASSRNVVHRDIKPSNVLVAKNGQAKLVDMGLARLHRVEQSQDLTATGVTLGTFDYISPEQARDPRDADVRSDIYSLGCTLYFMLTARPPFPEGTALQKLLQHQGDSPPDPRDFNPYVPEEVARIIRRMLAKDPRRRYQDPASLIAELKDVADELSIKIQGAAVEAAPLRPRSALATIGRQHLPWLVPLVLLVGSVFALDVYWSGHEEAVPRTIAGGTRDGGADSGHDLPGGADGGGPSTQTDGGAHANQGTVTEPPIGTHPRTDSNHAETRPEAIAIDAPSLAASNNGASLTSPSGEALGAGATVSGADLRVTVADEGVSAELSLPLVDPASARPAAPAPVPEGLLIVDPRIDLADNQRFKTLRAACEAASGGDAIELRFNGPLEEKPFKLKDLDITIRAGEGYQPSIVFRPTSLDLDAATYPRNMITVQGGSLTVLGVQLVFRLPQQPANGAWSLFALQQCELVLKQRCLLTVVNATELGGADHEQVSFVSLVASTRNGAMMVDKTLLGDPTPVVIRLFDCVARGEAVFIRGDNLQPFSLDWQNGLLATTETLFTSTGGQMEPRGGKFEIHLDQLTANVQSGLCRLTNSEDYPYQLKTEIDCKNSILQAASDSVLVEQAGVHAVAVEQERFAWKGGRNAYEGFRTFWKITDLTASEMPESLEYERWLAHWDGAENPSQRGHIRWRSPLAQQRPMNTHMPADYELDDRETVPPSVTADDGKSPGLRAPSLPTWE